MFGIVIAPAVIVPLVSILVTFVLPNLILLEASTIALYPIAVAFVRLFDPTSELDPIKVLLEPVVFVSPALDPTAVLSSPVVVAWRLLYPKPELLSPSANTIEDAPIAVL